MKWYKKQLEKWNITQDQWYMAHEEVAKIKRFPTYDKSKQKGKLVLVTAMNPTPSGEGKTTTLIALADALKMMGKDILGTLRQPSMGPVFGRKGGATGGGKSSVIPRDQIDLGLSGDFYAVENANNMMAALLDNHMYFKQKPTISHQVLWKRCVDMNDRDLRQFYSAYGERGFTITAASEVMAILSLSKNFKDLKEKLGECVLALDGDQNLVRAKDLNFHKAPAILLRDALYPNLVKTMEDTPILMHAGPFANIAQGTNSIIATGLALELADYVVTEAGFGADLGAEKFFNIKCRKANLDIACTVLVVTTKAMEHHGMENVQIHLENLKSFGSEVVVTINRFPDDTDEQLADYKKKIEALGHPCEVNEGFLKGGEGAMDLAKMVVDKANPTPVQYTYDLKDSIETKVEKVAKKIYRAKDVQWSAKAKKKLQVFKDYAELPVCMAKTPLSLSDDTKKKFVKDGHTVQISDLRLQAGSGFIVALTGDVMLLPGLPKGPRAFDVDLTDDGKIVW